MLTNVLTFFLKNFTFFHKMVQYVHEGRGLFENI